MPTIPPHSTGLALAGDGKAAAAAFSAECMRELAVQTSAARELASQYASSFGPLGRYADGVREPTCEHHTALGAPTVQ